MYKYIHTCTRRVPILIEDTHTKYKYYILTYLTISEKHLSSNHIGCVETFKMMHRV